MSNVRGGRRRHDDGSSLVEALVATLVLVTGVLVMAQLVSVATASNLSAQRITVATILAEQKLERLRALTWGYDAAGLPVGDISTDTTTVPESPAGGTGLQSSPADALRQNTLGFVDHIGADGRIVGNGTTPPDSAVYTRRWSIGAVTADGSALIIQVLVTAHRNRQDADRNGNVRLPGDARIATIKARKAR